MGKNILGRVKNIPRATEERENSEGLKKLASKFHHRDKQSRVPISMALTFMGERTGARKGAIRRHQVIWSGSSGKLGKIHRTSLTNAPQPGGTFI